MSQLFENFTMKVHAPDEFRTELMPALPGSAITLKSPPSAQEAGEPEYQTLPVLAWVVYWLDPDNDYPRPMLMEPLFLWPATGPEWNSDYDFGGGTCPSDLNDRRRESDQYKWRIAHV